MSELGMIYSRIESNYSVMKLFIRQLDQLITDLGSASASCLWMLSLEWTKDIVTSQTVISLPMKILIYWMPSPNLVHTRSSLYGSEKRKSKSNLKTRMYLHKLFTELGFLFSKIMIVHSIEVNTNWNKPITVTSILCTSIVLLKNEAKLCQHPV